MTPILRGLVLYTLVFSAVVATAENVEKLTLDILRDLAEQGGVEAQFQHFGPIRFAESPTKPVRPRHYRVQRGDSLLRIAERFNTTVSALVAMNNLERPHLIQIGQILRIPVAHDDYRTGRGDTLAVEDMARREPEADAHIEEYGEFRVELALEIARNLAEQVQ